MFASRERKRKEKDGKKGGDSFIWFARTMKETYT